MGLDLIVSNRALPGNEETYWPLWCDWMITAGKRVGTVAAPPKGSLWQRLTGSVPVPLTQDERATRITEMAQPAFATLDAPVVGQDASADEWARANLGEDALQRAKGYHVLQLLPEHDGFPAYSNGALASATYHIDRTSFRGAFLLDCTAFLDEMDLAEAHSAMTPQELEIYGTSLRRAAQHYASAHDVTDVLGKRLIADDAPKAARDAHIADSCGRWAHFWSERGHGCEPYF